jgi:hypothetical protein
MAGLVQVVQKALSTENPTEKDVKLSEGLMALMNAECLIPTQDESDRRVKSIGKLNEMVSLASSSPRSDFRLTELIAGTRIRQKCPRQQISLRYAGR